MAESDKADNAKDGLFLGDVEDWTPKDPATIGPNGKRPIETSPTAFAMGPGHPA